MDKEFEDDVAYVFVCLFAMIFLKVGNVHKEINVKFQCFICYCFCIDPSAFQDALTLQSSYLP